MANTKEYKIVINGLTESIDAVKSLNSQLDSLEQRMNKINATKVSGGGASSSRSNASALSEEEAIQREINKLKKEGETLDAKRMAAQDDEYQKVLAMKDLYKETIQDQKTIAAQERLTADAYSNTMAGMKQQLADLKAVINTTDLGDSDKIKQMTADAGKLTDKLKQMEEAYGQFGRNVGNYKSAADGFKGLAIQVGDTTKEFDNAKQALKELKKERDTLATKKDMGLISEEEAKRLQDLIPVVAQLQSSIQDAGKPMDALMDSMQSFVAVMQSAKGISAFFGLDNTKVEESIQKLVALQNAMQGLQTIQKQIQEKQGIGVWLSKGNAAIDAFTKKLFGLGTATKATNTALATTGTAGKTAAVGLGTASVAANTATKSFSLAAAAATALRVVLSALGIGLIIGAISALVEGIGYLIDKQKEAKKFQEDLNNAIGEGQKEYAKTSVELSQLKSKLDNFNGSKKQEKKLVEELNSKYGTSIGQYKSLKEWKDALIAKGEAYAKVLKLEAENQALLNMYTENYIKLMHAKDLAAKGADFWDEAAEWLPWNWGGKSAQDKLNDTVNEIESAGNTILSKIEENNKEIERLNKNNSLFDYAPQIEKNTNKTKKAMDEAEKTLNQLELRLMQEGLNKKLRQLDEEERQTINKLKENGRKTGSEIQKIQRVYSELRKREIQEYLKNIEESIKKSAQDIKKIQFEIDTKEIDLQINDLKNQFDKMSDVAPKSNVLVSRVDVINALSDVTSSGVTKQQLKDAYDYLDKLKEKQISADTIFEMENKEALSIVSSYGSQILDVTSENLKKGTDFLADSFRMRDRDMRLYYAKTIELMVENIKKQSELNKKRIDEQYQQDIDAEKERYRMQFNTLSTSAQTLEAEIAIYEARNDADEKELEEMKKNKEELYRQMETALIQHSEKMGNLTYEMDNAIKKNEFDTLNEISNAYEKYFDQQLSNYRDFQSKLNDEVSRNPITDKTWGIVLYNQTKRNYKEIMNASNEAISALTEDKLRLNVLYANGFIDENAFNATMNSLTDLEKQIRNDMAVTANASKNLMGDLIGSISKYVNAVGQTLEGILSAVWNYEDYQFDKEKDELDKYNEELEKALDKQQNIIQEHKSAIDDIESELANARGDRRQHLIDQLNAEIAAQRKAEKERQKIEKEKEKAQKRQDALDKKRREAEYNRNIASILVSGAMAVTNAFATQPFVPTGLAMGALATTLTAVQYALAKQQKPYANGGQLEGGVAVGRRHRDGGIPVLGGRASIEGGEFITNRVTTSKNVDLLEYINSKKKRVDISDLIDFYNTAPRKTIKAIKTSFADGGSLPTLPNMDLREQLQNIVVNQDNRPIYVSVVDINNKQEEVRKVQTLAGLSD